MAKTSTYFWLSLWLVFRANFSFSQSPKIQYTINDGLPSNKIYDVHCDSNSLVWLATDRGVSLFNGFQFENFTTNNGLSDNECFFFEPDRFGRLWIGTLNGKMCFYKNGVFHNEQNTPWLKLPLNGTHTTNIISNADSTVTFFLQDHPAIFEIADSKINYYTSSLIESKYATDRFLFAKKASKSKYFLIYEKMCLIYDFAKQRVEYQLNFDSEVQRVIKSNNDRIFIYDKKNRLSVFDDNFKLKPMMLLPSIKTFKIIELNNNQICVATNEGLFYSDGTNTKLNQAPAYGLASINSTFFIGTESNGLLTIDSKRTQNLELEHKITQPFFINNNYGFLVVGSDGKIYALENKTFLLKNDATFGNNEKLLNCLVVDGFLYLFTDIRAYKLNLIKKNAKIKPIHFNSFVTSVTASVFNRSSIYLKTRRFIYEIERSNLAKDGVVKIKNKYSIGKNIESIYDLALNNKNQIFISTLKNLFTLKNDTVIRVEGNKGASFRNILFLKNKLLTLNNNEIHIFEHYDDFVKPIDTITSSSCIWDNFHKVNDSTALITTNNHFYLLQLYEKFQKLNYKLIAIDDPLFPLHPQGIFTSPENLIFFSNTKMSSFKVEQLLKPKHKPKIAYANVLTNKGKYFLKNESEINLGYDEAQNVKINIKAQSFYSRGLKYQFSLGKKNSKELWQDFLGEELNVLKIGYGDILIRFRAITLSNNYSDVFIIKLNISRPFYASFIFISFSMFIVLGTTILLTKIWFKRLAKKKEMEYNYYKSEYKALNAMMNPHFIFNALNSIQGLVYGNEKSKTDKYITVLSKLIRQNLNHVSSDLISIEDELNFVENYLEVEKLRYKEKFKYSINILEDIDLDEILIPPLLIQPLVENAIKHGVLTRKENDGTIEINVKKENHNVYVQIIDNGNGDFHKSEKSSHKSYALHNINQRIKQIEKIHGLKINLSLNKIYAPNKNILGYNSTIAIEID